MLRYGDKWTRKKSEEGDILKGPLHQSNLRPASVLSIAGQLIRTLAQLIQVDTGFLRYTRHPLLFDQVKGQGDAVSVSNTETQTQVMGRTGTQRSLPPTNEQEESVATQLARCCSLVLRSSVQLLETPWEELKKDEFKACNYEGHGQVQGQGQGQWQGQFNVSIMPVRLSTAYVLRSSLLSVYTHTGMCSIPTETKELLLNFRASDADNVVGQVLSLIGKICSQSSKMIESFTDEKNDGTGLLDTLFSMPPRYFRDSRYSTLLLPVLTTLFVGRESELDIMIQELQVK